MKKIVTGIVMGLALLALVGCGKTSTASRNETMGKTQLKTEYTKAANIMAPMASDLAYNNFVYTSNASQKKAKNVLSKIDARIKSVSEYKDNDNKKQVLKYYDYSKATLRDITSKKKGEKTLNDLSKFMKQNHKIRTGLNMKTPKKLDIALDNLSLVFKKNQGMTNSEFLLSDNGKKDLGDGHVTVTDNRTYYFGESDTSWSPAKITINNVEVAKTKEFTVTSGGDSKQYQGLIAINIDTKANKDISAFYTQGSLVTSDGQQLDAESTFSDIKSDVYAGAKVNGSVVFLVPKLKTASSLTNVKYIFSAALSKGSSIEHDFNYQLPLKK